MSLKEPKTPEKRREDTKTILEDIKEISTSTKGMSEYINTRIREPSELSSYDIDIIRGDVIDEMEVRTDELVSSMQKSIRKLKNKIKELRPNLPVEPTGDKTEDELYEKLFLTFDENRELRGAAGGDEYERGSDPEINTQLLKAKIEGYDRDAEEWDRLADTAREKGEEERERIFRLAVRGDRLYADKLRLEHDQRVKSEEGLNILNNTAEDHPLTKFERFRRWAKKNLGKASGAAILVGGVITSIVLSLKSFLKKGAKAVGGFAKALGNLALKAGPMLSAVFGLIAKMADLGSKGVMWLASNLWFLLVLTGWFLYDRYNERTRTITRTRTRRTKQTTRITCPEKKTKKGCS